MTDQRAVMAQMIGQRIADFVVEEREQPVAGVEQVDLDAEPGEDRGVFATDNPGTEDDQGARRVRQPENGVRAVDARVTEVDIRRAIRARAGRDNDLLGVDFLDALVVIAHQQSVLILEAGHAKEHVDAITRIEGGTHFDLLVDGHLRTLQHLGKREPPRLADIAKHAVGVEGHNLLDLMAQRLGGNGTPVGAVATHGLLLFDDCYALAMLRGVDRGAFARGTGTDHHHVVIMNCHRFS